MSLDVLRLMENRKIQDFSSFSNKSLTLNSEQNNQNESFKFTAGEDRMLEIKFNSQNDENLQVKCKDKFEKYNGCKEQAPFKFCSEIQPSLKRNSILCAKRKYSEVALSVFKNGAYFGSNIFLNVLIWFIDFIINICHNESIRDILMVILAVSVEVFVMLVFSVSTVLATVIVKIDEAFKKHHHESKYIGKRFLQEADEPFSKITTIAKAKSGRSRKKSSRNSIELVSNNNNSTDLQMYSKKSIKSRTPLHKTKSSLPSVNDLDLEIPECDIDKSDIKSKTLNDYSVRNDETHTNNENHEDSGPEDCFEKGQNEKELCVCKDNVNNKNAVSDNNIFHFGINELNETAQMKF